MYKLLIADDEAWIRERIVNTIDWSKVGAKVIGEACDGKEALEKVESLIPDIIITDIRMPCISGLEFIQELKQRGLNTEIIIISGYSDFDYAQKAVKFGVRDYLLKPVDDEELLRVVGKSIENLRKMKQVNTVLKDLEKKLAKNKPVLKERFYFELINGYINESTVESNLEYFEIQNNEKNYICFLVQLDQDVDAGKDAYLIQMGIKNVMQEFSSLLGDSQVISLQYGETVSVISSDMQKSELEKQVEIMAHRVKNVVFKLFQKSVTIGIGSALKDIMKISASFFESRHALMYKSYLGNNSIYTIQNNNQVLRDTSKHRYSIDQITNAVNNVKCSEAFRLLDKLIKDVEANAIRPIDLKVMYVDIVFSIIKSSFEYNNINQGIPMFDIEFFNQINEIYNIDDFTCFLKEKIKLLIDYLDKSRHGSKRKVVQMALEFIKENYNKQITLTHIAEFVLLNPSYFCKIFKSEMGISFTKYLMNYRMEKAVELMEDPTLKIYEIAEQVGYNDVQYFTKIFKSVKGVAPTQYRDKVR